MADLALAASKGRLDGLRALRDTLVAAIETDSGPQTASLARQLREVLREVDELERAQGRKGSIVDELADRRKARGSGTSGRAAAGRGRPDVGS